MNPQDCVFCAIAAGHEPASIVLDENNVLAFMSLEQPHPGKVLVIPRTHVETIYDLTDEQAGGIMRAAVRVARAIRAATGCLGLNLIQANGKEGQQDIFHVHLHLLPRFPDDTSQGRIRFRWDMTTAPRSRLDTLAANICSQLDVSQKDRR